MAEKLQARIVINNRLGLHARPASMFAQTANRFASGIQITRGNLTGDGKSILGLMTLGAPMGSELDLTIEGDDAAEMLAAINELVNGNFGES